MLVVDASVAVLWFVPQEHAELAADVLASRHRLLAPRLLRVEAASPLLRAVRRGGMSPSEARRVIESLIPLSVTTVDDPADELRAFEIAHAHGGSVQDGVYIALAERVRAALVTNDQRMHRTAEAAGVASRFLPDGPPW